MTFQGKNIVIIGASSGIGLSVAKRLLNEGAQIWSYSRHAGEQLPAGIHWNQIDVSTADWTLEALPEVIDGLVYCPGTINLKPFHRISAADLRTELEINTVGAFRAIQQALPALKKANGAGSVVLFSTVAVQTGMPFHAGIAAAKGAVEGLTHALSAELAPAIRINAIAPSLTDTPLASQLLSTDEKRQSAANRHALRRVGTPEDISNAVVFLLSTQSSFMTGQVMHVDGGMGNIKT